MANLALWLQALPTKTETKRSGSTEVSSEGLPGAGSAAKLMWFLKELSSWWVVGLAALLSAISQRPPSLPFESLSLEQLGSFFHQSQQGRV